MPKRKRPERSASKGVSEATAAHLGRPPAPPDDNSVEATTEEHTHEARPGTSAGESGTHVTALPQPDSLASAVSMTQMFNLFSEEMKQMRQQQAAWQAQMAAFMAQQGAASQLAGQGHCPPGGAQPMQLPPTLPQPTVSMLAPTSAPLPTPSFSLPPQHSIPQSNQNSIPFHLPSSAGHPQPQPFITLLYRRLRMRQ